MCKPTYKEINTFVQENIDEILQAVNNGLTSLSDPGLCVSCGDTAEGVEPDARNYICDSCEKPAVFGAQELIMYS